MERSTAYFDVGRRDLGTVLELDTFADLVGPGLRVVTGLAEVLCQVRDQLLAALPWNGLEHHQAARVGPHEVPRVAVVGVPRVDRVGPVAGLAELDDAALGGRRLVDAVQGCVELGCRPSRSCHLRPSLHPRRRHQGPARQQRRARSALWFACSSCPVTAFLLHGLFYGLGAASLCGACQRPPFGSRASRSPSPRRLKDKTVAKIARPGQSMKCGVV